ncbi:DNA-binding IclR family transcriptional regulator [Crossiella equi]|uniref:DNA-binding IclR family transcriptional regulator n=1 Tax=Crossiella equi TaxID=130796 RepID=A0ABS5AAT2_9PSEU|nr:IclR family transcriptional regulator [Crossiella equi]MBP2473304.1 DNA-binding IclR family transcriptional regulator [Crossiella equi]
MSQSLDRALAILTELAGGHRTLDELAAVLDVHKSTALRLLRTLEARRFVQREDVRHYRLGTTLFDLAHRALEERDVRRTVEPALRELNASTGHTVHLASYEDGEVIYIDKYDSRHQVRMYSRIGKSAPLHCTAVAKILLSALPETEQRRIVEGITFTRLTANTITEPGPYLAELRKVRAQGYAVDRSEHEDFIHCVGAPILGARGEVLAAVSMSVPKMLLDYDGLMALLPELRAAARKASADCGWRPETT